MTTWSLTSTCPGGVEICTGLAATEAQARAAALAATRARHDQRGDSGGCRHTLHIHGRLTAIVAAGSHEDVVLLHREVGELLDRLDVTPVPWELDVAAYLTTGDPVRLDR